MAIQIFYSMKTMSLQITKLEDEMVAVRESKRLEEIASKKQALLDMGKKYEKLVEEIGIVSRGMDEKDRTILRVARTLGECDVEMPDGFMKEVKNYIAKWRTTTRLEEAMRKIRDKKYAPVVIQEMKSNGLPPHFLYLAIQESSFDERAVGPRTKYGYAKGIWQFIPETAREYGLRVGPLVNEPQYDPLDKRFDFVAATKAAGRFLRDIYKTDAQASGLLVMASYNWGPTPIKERIRQMPENPADRNFWKLLKYHKIPKETYDYVFYIFSAIVIGENPKLFGFGFDNPLADLTA
jgi:membrane-bound lytic murein transglycosylase D